MRKKPAVLLIAAAMTALLAVGGCTSTGASNPADEYGEQNGLEVGATAPDFRLKNQEQATVALSDYKGVKNVILVFYPADFTPV